MFSNGEKRRGKKGKDKKRKKNALLSSNTYIAIFSRNSSVVKKKYICLRGGANI